VAELAGKDVIVEGDYVFRFQVFKDGTSLCERTPTNDQSGVWEELLDWAQLPEGVRRTFAVMRPESKKSRSLGLTSDPYVS